MNGTEEVGIVLESKQEKLKKKHYTYTKKLKTKSNWIQIGGSKQQPSLQQYLTFKQMEFNWNQWWKAPKQT